MVLVWKDGLGWETEETQRYLIESLVQRSGRHKTCSFVLHPDLSFLSLQIDYDVFSRPTEYLPKHQHLDNMNALAFIILVWARL